MAEFIILVYNEEAANSSLPYMLTKAIDCFSYFEKHFRASSLTSICPYFMRANGISVWQCRGWS